MEDFASQINQLLSSPEGMQQIQNIAAALGLGGGNGAPPPPATVAPSAFSAPSPPAGNSGFDVNQIMGMLNQLGLNKQNSSPPQPEPVAAQPAAAAPNIDVNQIAGMLSKLGLGAGGNQGCTANNAPAIDLNMMMQVQKAMQRFAAGNKNVDLLRSLKPHFSEARQKKVDDAIKIMQLINMLPMLKETGLFGWGGDKQ